MPLRKLVENLQYLNIFYIFIFSVTILSACSGVDLPPSPQINHPDTSNQVPELPDLTEVSQNHEPTIHLPVKEIDPIRRVWFYKPPKENVEAYLAENYDMFILTKLDESLRDELMYSYGVSSPILRYIRFDAIMDPGSCLEQPYRNQVADEIGDFCRISSEHPDWFLLDRNGDRIPNDDGNFYLMDPGNQEWRNFWLERVEKNQKELGWEGLFLDNVEAGFSKRARLNSIPLQYTTDVEYQAAIKGFLEFIYETYSVPNNQVVYANVLSDENLDGLLSYLPYLDGVMVEGFAVDWNDGYRTPQEWNRQLGVIELLGKENLGVIMVAKGDEVDPDRLMFAFASYLLVTNGKTYFRFVLNNRTNEIVNSDNYNLDLGQPLGSRVLEGDTWIRVFEKGVVRVNPGNEKAEILINQ